MAISDKRRPVDERGSKEGQVLESMYEVIMQRRLEQRRHMPEPERQSVQNPGQQRACPHQPNPTHHQPRRPPGRSRRPAKPNAALAARPIGSMRAANPAAACATAAALADRTPTAGPRPPSAARARSYGPKTNGG